jgi:hypothetical protein
MKRWLPFLLLLNLPPMKSALHAVLWTVTVFATTVAQALILQPLSVEELSQRADVIVRGVVSNKTCLRDAEGRIYTKLELQVSEVLKGTNASGALTVVHGGGTIGNRRQEVSGQAEFAVGEEIIGFFVFNPRGEAVTLGLCQGKFEVWLDTGSGVKLARNIFQGAAPTETPPAPAAQQAASTPQSPAPLKLSDLKAQIQQALK